ncbi:mitochondrial protein C2orf69 homolog [Ciona intestinalis]
MIMSISTLENVEGISGRTNNIVHHHPHSDTQPSPCDSYTGKDSFHGDVIFFPGDLQDFSAKMASHYQCMEFVEWSYEKTLKILSKKFPHAHIWLVVPSKKTYQTICVYKNFLKVESIMGIPDHTREYDGLLHIEALFKNAVTLTAGVERCNNTPIVLAGFSKGCVVLNQLLFEIANLGARSHDEGSVVRDFIGRVRAMYWLDGGHTGEKDVWITDPDVVSDLKASPMVQVKIFIHVTPYQVRDPHRPWKGESETTFLHLLLENKFNAQETLHFGEEEGTINSHFKVLQVF